jgi:hypothetical protein
MSRSNIIATVPSVGTILGEDDSVLVTFKLKNGSTRTYKYTGADAIAVVTGSDPADLDGERVS